MRIFFKTVPMVYLSIARFAAWVRRGPQPDAPKDAQRTFAQATGAQDGQAAATENHRFYAVTGAMAHTFYLVASLDRLLVDYMLLSQRFYCPTNSDEKPRIVKQSDQHDRFITDIDA